MIYKLYKPEAYIYIYGCGLGSKLGSVVFLMRFPIQLIDELRVALIAIVTLRKPVVWTKKINAKSVEPLFME